jgi:hypothetical protein
MRFEGVNMNQVNVVSVVRTAAMIAVALVLISCGSPPSAPTPANPAPQVGFKPVASILDLMSGQIDPAADFLWESVATINGPKGLEEKQPRTDAEWVQVRHKALTIMEGASLLLTEGRVVANPGQELEEPGGEGDFTPDQAQAEIAANRPIFVTFARALYDAGGLQLAAAEKRDAEALLESGGTLDEACEQCHRKFWYPGAPIPPGT